MFVDVKTLTKNLNIQELKKFGYVMATGFAGFFGLILPWLFNASFPVWPFIMAGAFLFSSVVWPLALKPFYIAWMFLGGVLGWINTRIILFLCYYLIMVPTGLVKRAFGKDSMAKTWDSSAISYRHNVDPNKEQSLERSF